MEASEPHVARRLKFEALVAHPSVSGSAVEIPPPWAPEGILENLGGSGRILESPPFFGGTRAVRFESLRPAKNDRGLKVL